MPKIKNNKQILKKTKPKLKLYTNRILSTDIILCGISNENAARIMEKDNTLSFKCRNDATKTQIKNAFIELYDQDVVKVNTANTVKGFKKAYIRLKEQGAALKVASEAGIL